MSKLAMVSILALFNLHNAKDCQTQPDVKTIHAKMNALTCGLIDNVNNKDQYLNINRKDITQLLAQTTSIKTNSNSQKWLRRRKQPSFRQLKEEIINYREILTSAMEEQDNQTGKQ